MVKLEKKAQSKGAWKIDLSDWEKEKGRRKNKRLRMETRQEK